MAAKLQLMAAMAGGFEAVTAKELQSMGYETHNETGRVAFTGDMTDVYKTNLWLRSADRILIVLREFKAFSFDDLFNVVADFAWEEWLPMTANFPITAKSVKSKLHSEPDVQSIVKKAIVERLSAYYHRRTRLPETGATYHIDVRITKDVVRLTLDTTGESLFKRGYRAESAEAPLKENFAAALILLTSWHPADMPFLDPVCGSGTIPIEAALIGRNIAPGLQRHFAFEGFQAFDPPVFNDIKAQAIAAQTDEPLMIFGQDIDQNMIELSRVNAHKAGVLHDIRFKQLAVKDFKTTVPNGIIVANPPYGKRLADSDTVHQLYAQMGDAFRPLTTWSKYILTSDLEFERYFGNRATKRRKLYNGALRTDYFQYWGRPNWKLPKQIVTSLSDPVKED
ncbi:THUMP domain-containing class I SAM-dependent RNA methyltransferase [Schleiferilactobacillus perolens]|jgi:putative N6-adenine-specific DNA methylase|uniref:THUMP domain-containing protein n=1 Tax=Schleiferilactobacillus perolens DSM 12744 TaxID=1423792 RepID=A0A0R1N961_9LACO|nr:class I SAM-dependent RNA methyltransferase [Schleiferilactobacillus perolens]KRL14058.1 hypothetical protein FD09_GL001218 [Schleiferilactobacillus perolens DSM 12744]MCI1890763.1 class I SAM-dependent RNA methyltransferase [Schleiferilactobacillus harbinensis]MCI1912261.1 class I SAM-dependent RNA methyltransferase [Schleiferilactobacillus harbinensis]MCI2171918.1 class I SAM-dependent RNA methyltransferase [Schleiferilactobacillus perolens]